MLKSDMSEIEILIVVYVHWMNRIKSMKRKKNQKFTPKNHNKKNQKRKQRKLCFNTDFFNF